MTVRSSILFSVPCIGLAALLFVGCSQSDSASQPATGDTASSPPSTTSGSEIPATVTANRPVDEDAASTSRPRQRDRRTQPVEQLSGHTATGSQRRQPTASLAGEGSKPADGTGESLATAEVTTGSGRVSLPPPAEPTGRAGTDPGDTVMEIEGKDLDDERFALSDYEGKVIMLDFWGDW